MIKKILISILVSFTSIYCFGEGDTLTIPGTWSIGAKIQTGYLLAHRPSLEYIQKDKIKCFEISYLKSGNGKAEWERAYNVPLYGFAYQYFNLGNKQYLGYGHSVYSLVVFPLLHKHHLGMNIRFGVGIGYIEKRYTLEEYYKNQAISTHINGFLTTGIQFRIPCNSKTQISTGIDFSHFSNGATRLPNAGLNIPTVNIGIQHFFGEPIKASRGNLSPYSKRNVFTMYSAFGMKAQGPHDHVKVAVGILEGDLHFRVSRKSMLGFGADYFYDSTIQGRLVPDDTTNYTKIQANSRIGIHISYGIIVGKFEGYIQPGFYLYNVLPVDANMYNRLSLRYYASKHVFVCFNLKTHFAKADYFEYGIGYRI